MILIDALNVNSGGGVALLEKLAFNLKAHGVEHYILLDGRYSEFGSIKDNCKKIKSSILKRSSIIEKNIEQLKPNLLLCFGNFPPPKKFENVKVITYFQNCLLIPTLVGPWMSIKEKLLLFAKSIYIKLYLNNSNYYIFQTAFVRSKFIEYYNPKYSKNGIFPFYDVPTKKKFDLSVIKEKDSFIYVSSESSHKNHKNLFSAWSILSAKKLYPKLIVTLPSDIYDSEIKLLKQKSCNILNIGSISQDEVVNYLSAFEFTIFPSFIETIGLGIAEGIFAGNKILSSNLPFFDDIVEPSLSFNPYDPMDIATKVEFAMLHKVNLKDSKLKIENNIDEFIEFLKQNFR